MKLGAKAARCELGSGSNSNSDGVICKQVHFCQRAACLGGGGAGGGGMGPVEKAAAGMTAAGALLPGSTQLRRTPVGGRAGASLGSYKGQLRTTGICSAACRCGHANPHSSPPSPPPLKNSSSS